MKLRGGNEMKENDKPIDRTVIKIRTKENMYYTFMEFPWDQLEHDDNCDTFDNVRDYAKFLAKGKIVELVYNTDNNLIYLVPENMAISKDSIKEIFIDETIALAPRD